MRKTRVYVAGPYTKGDVAVNVRNAIEAANHLMDVGYTPYLPHLTHFHHLIFPRPYQDWLDQDNEWVPLCDAFLRLPGESSGADAEIELAVKHGIPVFTDVADLLEALSPVSPPRTSSTGSARAGGSRVRAKGEPMSFLTSDEVRHILERVGREIVVKETDDFRFEISRRRPGYSDEATDDGVKVRTLQAKLSIMLQAAVESEQ